MLAMLRYNGKSAQGMCSRELLLVIYMRSSSLCIATYDAKNLCGTNLCNLCFTHIIRINKSHAEICRFTVHSLNGQTHGSG